MGVREEDTQSCLLAGIQAPSGIIGMALIHKQSLVWHGSEHVPYKSLIRKWSQQSNTAQLKGTVN